MRGLGLILIALFATITWGAPSKWARKDVDLPPGVYIRGGNIFIDNPPPASGETGDLADLAEEEKEEERVGDDQLPPFPNGTGSFIATDSGRPSYWPSSLSDMGNSTSTSNGTAMAMADSGKQLVDLRMGGLKVHVGTIRKRRMYDIVTSCLETKCQEQDCFEPSPFKGKTCYVPNIVYDAGDNKYATKKSHLAITIRAIHKSKEFPGLDAVARDAIAAMYQFMTEEPDNCYNIDFKGSRRTTLCNVAQQTLVAYPVVGSNKNLSVFYVVSVNYSRDYNVGTFEGSSAIGTVKNWFDEYSRAKFGRAVGTADKNIVARVNWVGKQCFLPDWWWDCNNSLTTKEGS
ncbi:hypothetical protein NX059_001294 [Plenodomus lindquistii]|nr:hypothetical protein NX059_001294 [Plenodomus lindquistii]